MIDFIITMIVLWVGYVVVSSFGSVIVDSYKETAKEYVTMFKGGESWKDI